jgi:hypothetical protein
MIRIIRVIRAITVIRVVRVIRVIRVIRVVRVIRVIRVIRVVRVIRVIRVTKVVRVNTAVALPRCVPYVGSCSGHNGVICVVRLILGYSRGTSDTRIFACSNSLTISAGSSFDRVQISV